MSIRLLLALCIAIVAAFSIFAAKWNLGNAISTRADTKDLADLAVSMAPDDPQTRYAAAVIYDKTLVPADAERSMSEFQAAVNNSSNNHISWLALAQAKIRSGDIEGAEADAARALQLAPNYASVNWVYGNLLYRNGREMAMTYIRSAAEKDERYQVPAVSLVMNEHRGDVAKVKSIFGDSPRSLVAIAQHFVLEKRFQEAHEVWLEVPADVRRSMFRDQAASMASVAVASNRYRFASTLLEDAGQSFGKQGSVNDGGFENGVKARGALVFEWQIADGSEPQIAISSSVKKSGANSLLLQFNTMEASAFRTVSQIVTVEPGTNYTLTANYRAELKASSTLKFVITDPSTGAVLASTSAFAAMTDWTTVTANFAVSSTADGISIALVRADCNASICPINGRLWLDDITLSK